MAIGSELKVKVTADASQARQEMQGIGSWGEQADAIGKQEKDRASKLLEEAGYNTAGMSGKQKAAVYEQKLTETNKQLEAIRQLLARDLEAGNTAAAKDDAASMNQMEQLRAGYEKELRAAKEGKDSSDSILKKGLIGNMISQGVGYAIQGANLYNGYRQNMANGNYAGADAAMMGGMGSSLMGLSGSLMMIPGIGPILGILSMLVGGGLSIGASNREADNAEADAYARKIAPAHRLNRLFGDGSEAENNANAFSLYKAAREKAAGTGLSTGDFLEAMATAAGYNRNRAETLEDTRNAALFSNSSGVDLGLTQRLIGTARNYGDKEDVLKYVDQARAWSGMGREWDNEFIESVTRAMEEGISKGFVRSAEDAAGTLAMFTRLSGQDPLWTGKQGQDRISRMQNGIAGATAMQSVEDVMTFQAARNILGTEEGRKLLGDDYVQGADWINEELLMERAPGALMVEMMKNLNSYESGGSADSAITRIKNMFHLSSTSEAAKLYRMHLEGASAEDLTKAIQGQTENLVGTYTSEETRHQDVQNILDARDLAKQQEKYHNQTAHLLDMADPVDNSTSWGARLADFMEDAKSTFSELKTVLGSIANFLARPAEAVENAANGAIDRVSIATGQTVSGVEDTRGFLAGANSWLREIPGFHSYGFDKFIDKDGVVPGTIQDRMADWAVGAMNWAATNTGDKQFTSWEQERLMRAVDVGLLSGENQRHMKSAFETGDFDRFKQALIEILKSVFGDFDVNLIGG